MNKTPRLTFIYFALCLSLSYQPAFAADAATAPAAAQEPTIAALKAARLKIKEHPEDAQARFQLGELLRQSGRQREAAEEYLAAGELDPTLYVAFHQLSLINADPSQLDEAIERLTKQKEEKPKDLLLRVALSELLEKHNQYYPAARVLIDVIYTNSVPQKLKPRINARIHYLLSRAKETGEESKEAPVYDEANVEPSPPPAPPAHKSASKARVKGEKEMKGVGHVPLLQ